MSDLPDQPVTPDNFAELRGRLPALKVRTEKLEEGVPEDSRLHHVAQNLLFMGMTYSGFSEEGPHYDDGTHEEYEKARGFLETLDLYLQTLEEDPKKLDKEQKTTQTRDIKLPPFDQYVAELARQQEPSTREEK